MKRELPKHIQRSHYSPNRATRRRDDRIEKGSPGWIARRQKTESMVLRGPGTVGNTNCQAVAVFSDCPDELMDALIHRYNQHNYLMEERERLKAHGRKKIRLIIRAIATKIRLRRP